MRKFKIRIYIVPFWKHKCDFFYYRKWTYVKGFSIRIFGVHIQIVERNALEKLIDIWRGMAK